MPIIVADTGGGDFTPIPAGNHHAICYGVVDLGTQEGFGNFGPKREVLFLWELPFERGKFERDGEKMDLPRAISNHYTASLGSKANLRKMLESWRGKAFTEVELKGFDLQKVINANCMLNVVHKNGTGKNANKTYANVVGVSPLAKGMAPKKPENPPLYFSFDDYPPGAAVLPDHMPEWIQEKIQRAEEWEASAPPAKHQGEPEKKKQDIDEDVPF